MVPRLAVAAGGLLRLLLATRPYASCRGGATYLATYMAVNETSINGPIHYVADYVRPWQVRSSPSRPAKHRSLPFVRAF
jgi:hypothetical protein